MARNLGDLTPWPGLLQKEFTLLGGSPFLEANPALVVLSSSELCADNQEPLTEVYGVSGMVRTWLFQML